MTILSLKEVPVIAQWIRHSPVVSEVVSSPLAGGREIFGVLDTRLVLSFPTQVLVSNQHKRVSFIYDTSVVFWRSQICVLATQVFYSVGGPSFTNIYELQ